MVRQRWTAGRPVDVLQLRDGSLLVSDNQAGVVGPAAVLGSSLMQGTMTNCMCCPGVPHHLPWNLSSSVLSSFGSCRQRQQQEQPANEQSLWRQPCLHQGWARAFSTLFGAGAAPHGMSCAHACLCRAFAQCLVDGSRACHQSCMADAFQAGLGQALTGWASHEQLSNCCRQQAPADYATLAKAL